jgi:hypothetical protein
MTLREKLLAAAGVILFVLLLFGFRAWMEQHDARIKAESTEGAQLQLIGQAQKQAEAAKADAAKVASDLKAQLAAIEKQKQQPVTAPQFVVDLNKLLPNLPQPVTVVQVPTETKAANGETKAGPPETVVQIPGADLQDLKAYKLDCDASAAKLDACVKISGDTVAQLNASKAEFDLMAKDRDNWKVAAGKGSIFQRIGRRMKCLAVVGGASALGAWADKDQPYRGAAIGATAGGVGCELF